MKNSVLLWRYGMEQISLDFRVGPTIYTVRELNAAIRATLDERFGSVLVAGEISGVRPAASGHFYFTLKEQDAQIKCVCYRMTARYLKFKPQDGIAVLARGRIDVYEVRGEYQLIVDHLEPQGHGALQFAFEQLKKKLADQGLFDQSRKRSLPKLPRRIGIVTSPSGAAIRDMLNILGRRFPGLHIRLYPAQVQGEGSVEDVCRGIRYFGESGWAEVVIVGRGGGSLEDLWTFNEEAVARAIAASPVPIVSAVGHETDFTIADFVADLRAPTPSAAAELVVSTREQIEEQIETASAKLVQSLRYRLLQARRRLHERGIERAEALLHREIGRGFQRVDDLDFRMRHAFRERLDACRRRLLEAEGALQALDLRVRFSRTHRRLEAAEAAAARLLRERLVQKRARFDRLTAQLEQLSPLKVLERGYAIVQGETGRVIKDAAEAPPPATIRVRLARGGLTANVTATEPATPEQG